MARLALLEKKPDAPVQTRLADRIPKRAELLAAVPAAVELAKRIPSGEEVGSKAADARDAAVDAALDAARRTPLRDRLPAPSRGPGALGLALRVAVAAAIAGGVAWLIANRDRVGTWISNARERAMTMFGGGAGAFDEADTGRAWSADDAPGTTVDEVVVVETVGGSVAADQPVDDLDSTGWGTEGQPSAAREMSAEVTAMTTPSPNPEEPEGRV
jgi:hypothetical protein